MKLRLLLFKNCERHCEGCCNKEWDLDALPVCFDFRPYESIMLTGGEPMLSPSTIDRAIAEIRDHNEKAPIYLYTANVRRSSRLISTMLHINGMTITLHEQSDVEPFVSFIETYEGFVRSTKRKLSMRLNIFKGVILPPHLTIPSSWDVRRDKVWIPNCPLPEGEVFMRYM